MSKSSNRKKKDYVDDDDDEKQTQSEESETESDDEDEQSINEEEMKELVSFVSDKLFSIPNKNKQFLSKVKANVVKKENANETHKNNNKNINNNNNNNNNCLTKLIPGYTASMKLDSSSLDPYRMKTTTLTSSMSNKRTKELLSTTLPSSESSKIKRDQSSDHTKSAGPKWFHIQSHPFTESLQQDLKVIQNRNYMDPKKFYKSSDINSSSSKNKIYQVGTVVEGTGEFFSSRLTKKQRKSTLAEELMADEKIRNYTKRKFKEATSKQRPQKKNKKRSNYY
eukprot:CAMPEP_0178958560 /NCGR_PEP_ID=MMETSP0789-20121207/11700_1 /TAXON_ID=3005 /ORGANISM="Rhizosolenia setigera, Strain CCMP 1694" /LENGTH=280 /DNA_ID=CAMNT_0020641259 /DNA_START=54 /DNA_END=896 /DNA_ORIENTATION=-